MRMGAASWSLGRILVVLAAALWAPAAAFDTVAAAQAPSAPVVDQPPVPAIISPNWIERPNGADFERYYPFWAYLFQVEGEARLDCVVSVEGRLDCSVMHEAPAGWGFGDAAVRISRHFRMRPLLRDGRPTAAGRYRLRIPFRSTE
jgi:periplasmic protein TonB